MSKSDAAWWLVIGMLLSLSGGVTASCGGAAPVAKSALESVAPVAVDLLTKLIQDKFGSDAEVDVPSSRCVETEPDHEAFGEDYEDDEPWTYIKCRGKPVDGS